MENQNNLPKSNSSVISTKGIVIVLVVVAVFLAIIFAVFFAFNLGKREAISERVINKPAEVTGQVDTPKTSEVSSSTNSLLGHAVTGSEALATAQEKKAIGVLDFTEVKVLRRDDSGKIISFEEIPNPDDIIDSDNDGIADKKEKTLGTNPNNSDTDGDGISDYQELLIEKDPKVANDYSKK